MKVGELIQSDKEEWSRLYHGYAEFYEMEMNEDILNTVWSWIFNPDNKAASFGTTTEPKPDVIAKPVKSAWCEVTP